MVLSQNAKLRSCLWRNELVEINLRKSRNSKTVGYAFIKSNELFTHIGGQFGMILMCRDSFEITF
jgi:hypothetical protein